MLAFQTPSVRPHQAPCGMLLAGEMLKVSEQCNGKDLGEDCSGNAAAASPPTLRQVGGSGTGQQRKGELVKTGITN